MSALHLTVSDDLSDKAKKLAESRGLTIEQFAEAALQAQVAALTSAEYWKARAARGNPDDLIRILDMVPDVPPMPGDEISPENAAYYRAKRAPKS